MKRYFWIAVLAAIVFSACKGEKKMTQYSELYQQTPMTIYVAPLNDMAMRRAVRERTDSAYNASLGIAAQQFYLTAASLLTYRGYNVPGPLASAQLAATETRTGRQLRNENINDLYTGLGIDAVLFIDILSWKQTSCSWTVEAEYMLRSTHTNSELLHTHVTATKILPTDNKGNPMPFKDELDFQRSLDLDIATAQRCRMAEILNQYVLKDLPAGNRARRRGGERYDMSHPEYFTLRINRDGTVEMMQSTTDEL